MVVGERSAALARQASQVPPPSLRHHLRLVVGYDWLVAASIAPIAFAVAFLLSVVIPEAVRTPWRPPPVAVLCVAGYIFFEGTMFCLERTWARVSIWRFWRLAIPLAAVHALLCIKFARYDVLTCLLFTSLCLGCREFLFQLQASLQLRGPHHLNESSTQDKIMSAFFGGSAYGMVVALFCGLAGVLVHAVVGEGRKFHSPVMLDVLCALALPLGRNMSRMALNQAVLAASSVGRLDASPEASNLDALVMYADILFLLTVFLEVPFAFVFLLMSNTITFCLALVLNVFVDVLFVHALDTMQKHSQRRDPAVQRTDSSSKELLGFSPSYCIVRPESIFATLSGGVIISHPSESTALCPHESQTSSAEDTSICSLVCASCDRFRRRIFGDESSKHHDSMSPRISLLLDEHNSGVIGCWTGRTELAGSSGHSLLLQQERKIALTTHFLCSTLALVLVAVALPVAKYAGDNRHTEFLRLRHISALELAIRSCAALTMRILADLIALRILEQVASSSETGCGALPVMWESRHELSTFHGWLYRLLAATCPLFVVIAATL